MRIQWTTAAALLVTVLGIGAVNLALLGQNPADFTPYKEVRVSHSMVDTTLRRARSEHKILMVEFGANWCEDCRALARDLDRGGTGNYFQTHFVILKVDVGQFDKNLDIAKSLDVDVDRGIPTAAFFATDGSRIGATNKGELEPASKYGSKQIMAFLQDVAEHHSIVIPTQ
jgi:thiol:disulfide interchange protein